MEKIKFTLPEDGEVVEFFCLEETTINEQKYLLVSEEETGESEGYILKVVSQEGDDLTYEMVEDDEEFTAMVKVFEELMEDTDFEM